MFFGCFLAVFDGFLVFVGLGSGQVCEDLFMCACSMFERLIDGFHDGSLHSSGICLMTGLGPLKWFLTMGRCLMFGLRLQRPVPRSLLEIDDFFAID